MMMMVPFIRLHSKYQQGAGFLYQPTPAPHSSSSSPSAVAAAAGVAAAALVGVFWMSASPPTGLLGVRVFGLFG